MILLIQKLVSSHSHGIYIVSEVIWSFLNYIENLAVIESELPSHRFCNLHALLLAMSLTFIK